MLHDYMCYHTNPCRSDSTGLTKHLGNQLAYGKALHLGPKTSGMLGTTDHAPPTNTLQHFISGTTNILNALLNAQQITSPLHLK
jgi:hypothetical protein